MAYTQIGWQDSPSTATPESAANLGHMDAGIAANDATITTLTATRVTIGSHNAVAFTLSAGTEEPTELDAYEIYIQFAS